MAHLRFTTAPRRSSAVRVLAAVSACLAAAPWAAAQAPPNPSALPGYDATDLELTLPSSPTDPMTSAPEVEAIPAPAGESAGPVEVLAPPAPVGSTLQPTPADDHLLRLEEYGAKLESSGTWLERGFWYADTEAVLMSRNWNRHDVVLFQEFDAIQNQIILAQSISAATSLVPIQQQQLGQSSPDYDGSVRLTLGRFLFRDAKNRDHTLEGLFFGGGQNEESLSATAQLLGIREGIDLPVFDNIGNVVDFRNQQGLHLPIAIDGSAPLNVDDIQGFTSFDQASTIDVSYNSRFLDWEINYNVSERLDKDRLELLPTGEWVRRASPGFTYNYGAGLRYFDLEEQMNWRATEIRSLGVQVPDGFTQNSAVNYLNSPDGALRLHTTNDLYGFQFGAGATYQSDRWNVTLSTKQGFYINDARSRRQLTFTDDNGADANNFDLDLHENGVSYIGTGSIIARYHLRQNLSLRAGWEFMYITGLALAPNEANFNPAVGQQLHLGGDVFYHGVSFGTEMFW